MKTRKILLLTTLSPPLSFSLNGIGHMPLGAIAYYSLKDDNPAVLKKSRSTLEKYPRYSVPILCDNLAGLTAEKQNITLFMFAPTYPDDASYRLALGGTVKKEYYYVDYSFIPSGQTAPSRNT
ncbi:hypothetical protein [Mucilaginibacter sp. OK098]|uniref:hypothetical protein n=1 Tax=Mucilaginibacter sp. OK098 TaxID=1855297 RepID=UPI0009181516|nr:hypothetical protein [Mucilaginibacter sp. OK098]SHN26133.1 hypothetical protein SAMN05216524_107379 [Mucilaginibacter sp. OK098]